MLRDDFGRPPPKAWLHVQDPEQARLLADPKSPSFFGPFIGQERSAKAAAEEANVSTELMLYHIKRFLQAGLLVVTRLEPRAGRAIRHYRAVNDAFFVPLEVTPFADQEERLKSNLKKRQELIMRSTARVLREVGGEGRRIFRSSNGKIMSEAAGDVTGADILEDPAGPAAIDFDLGVNLTRKEAKALQLELYTLMKRYQQPERKGKRYLLTATLLPLETTNRR